MNTWKDKCRLSRYHERQVADVATRSNLLDERRLSREGGIELVKVTAIAIRKWITQEPPKPYVAKKTKD